MFLKKLARPAVAILVFSNVSWGAQDYRIEPGWSHIEFAVRNFGIHTVEGRFKTFTGTVSYDETDVTRSSVSVTILTTDIDTDSKKRDAHLRSEDFFETDHYPQMTFHSEHIVKKGDGYVMTGPLTIKDHTQSVELPFTFSFAKSSDGKPVLRAAATSTINRHDFDINYGNNFSVGKDVKITIHIQAIP